MRKSGDALVGREVRIIARASWAYGEWGRIVHYDGQNYHVALWDGEHALVFSRKEIKVK